MLKVDPENLVQEIGRTVMSGLLVVFEKLS